MAVTMWHITTKLHRCPMRSLRFCADRQTHRQTPPKTIPARSMSAANYRQLTDRSTRTDKLSVGSGRDSGTYRLVPSPLHTQLVFRSPAGSKVKAAVHYQKTCTKVIGKRNKTTNSLLFASWRHVFHSPRRETCRAGVNRVMLACATPGYIHRNRIMCNAGRHRRAYNMQWKLMQLLEGKEASDKKKLKIRNWTYTRHSKSTASHNNYLYEFDIQIFNQH